MSSMWREPSHWKRYRGGTAGKIWVDATGDGEFTRLFADSAAQYWSVSWVGDRIVFLTDAEGTGNLHSALPDGSDLRRHSSHEEFYARHASSDGQRVVYAHAGDLWLLESLDAEPYRLEIKLGGPRPGRARRPAPLRVGSFATDASGRASVVEIRGSAHWVTHRDGPAGALRVQPGVRVRLPQVLDATGRAVWVSDAGGEDALEIGTPEARSGRWPPGSSAACWSWPPRPTASTWPWPRTTGGCWSPTWTASTSASWTAPTRATSAGWPSRPIPAGWPGSSRTPPG
ncbi:hypothetical protein ACFQYP_04350 [Nonomuraea antimicrobica]